MGSWMVGRELKAGGGGGGKRGTQLEAGKSAGEGAKGRRDGRKRCS